MNMQSPKFAVAILSHGLFDSRSNSTDKLHKDPHCNSSWGSVLKQPESLQGVFFLYEGYRQNEAFQGEQGRMVGPISSEAFQNSRKCTSESLCVALWGSL